MTANTNPQDTPYLLRSLAQWRAFLILLGMANGRFLSLAEQIRDILETASQTLERNPESVTRGTIVSILDALDALRWPLEVYADDTAAFSARFKQLLLMTNGSATECDFVHDEVYRYKQGPEQERSVLANYIVCSLKSIRVLLDCLLPLLDE